MSLSEYKVVAGLAVSEMDRAREFYESKLGLSVGIDSGDNVAYRCAEGSVLHVYLSPEHAGKSIATLASWYVDDVEGVVDGADLEGRSLPALRRRSYHHGREGHRQVRGGSRGRLPQGPGWQHPLDRQEAAYLTALRAHLFTPRHGSGILRSWTSVLRGSTKFG